LTAKDVKFTFDCILNPNIQAASLRSYYEDSDAKEASQKYKIKVTAIDDYTVKVKWSKPYFQAEEFTLGIPIIPRHVYSVNEKGEPISFDFSSKEFAEGFNNHWANRLMCGTGPMIFKEWSKEERVVLERNTDYWGEPFFFSKVIFRCIPNPNTSRQQALQNELDWGPVAEKNMFLEGKEHENVKAGKVIPEIFDYPGYRYIGYNMKRELFKDKRVRWALAHAIPVQNIIDVVFKGLARRVTGPTLVGSTSYDATIPEIPFDLSRSAQLLSQAGWEDSDGSGVRSKVIAGEKVHARFDLMIFADAPSYLTIAEIIKENCRKVGVDVQISPAKWGLMLQKLRKKEFDAAMLGWGMSWKQDLFQIWHSSQADVPDSSNAISYGNSELDKLIEEMRVTLDLDKQIEMYHKMHRIIYDDQPYTFLFAEKATAFRDARLDNIKFYKIRPAYDAREWLAQKPRELAN
jgi:ABC-type transport system substrate-binding protein